MTTFLTRRLTCLTVTVLCAGALVWVHWLHELSLRDASFLSGWILICGMVFLAFFNVRKKLPFLPILSGSLWLQAHIYLGLLVTVMFFVHTSLRWPLGLFETVLWWAVVLLALSGVIGLLLSRLLPNMVRERGERMIYERIPGFRAELAQEAEDLAMKSVTESGSSAITSFYTQRLQGFFQGPRNTLAHLRGTVEPLNKVRNEIASLQRYLNAEERAILGEIESRVVLKDQLDRQFALQSILKLWLFVHIPLTYLVLLLSLLHVLLVYAFATGSL